MDVCVIRVDDSRRREIFLPAATAATAATAARLKVLSIVIESERAGPLRAGDLASCRSHERSLAVERYFEDSSLDVIAGEKESSLPKKH